MKKIEAILYIAIVCLLFLTGGLSIGATERAKAGIKKEKMNSEF